MDAFVNWFRSQNGFFDADSMDLTTFFGHGRGAMALRDISEGHTLFTIPREITLSTRTSSLPGLLGRGAWNEFGLGRGWVGLILCMMWEESQGSQSKWSGYMSSLPTAFDTPMFWNDGDLQELQGTAVVDKIGRDEAERDYHEKLIPAIKSRADLFPAESISQFYTLERYHIMGSLILSRSFHVERWNSVGDEEDAAHENEQKYHANSMDVDDEAQSIAVDQDTLLGGEDDVVEDTLADQEADEEDVENSADVAMVPMADLLNARFESENAKLFYEERDLKMVTTRPIKVGEQIWNTYGDPPNSDLLRRYGHVDLVPLRQPLTGEGNPGDIVEIRADLVVSVASQTVAEDLQARVDWWLEEADDDTFVILTDCQLPNELVSFVRLLFLSQQEWEKTRAKSKLPKPKVDSVVLSVVMQVLERRLREYPTTIEVDEALLAPGTVDSLSLNKKHAVIVRLGEKRILCGTLQETRKLHEQMSPATQGNRDKKRARENNTESGRGKRAKR
ncbi:SET domain-containing protein [Sparassis crispa]|uniref:SET domain-containing protein n=1 Tax=Sparassis crispa TaxID=139825 RepID=A0A401GE74_9APHY|nr:SET domain-containing protein [Sparassis crispa]GBE80467.1 SET domain-containing protein [Sparassis crispa]